MAGIEVEDELLEAQRHFELPLMKRKHIMANQGLEEGREMHIESVCQSIMLGERPKKRTRTTRRGAEEAIILNSVEELARTRAAQRLREKGRDMRGIMLRGAKATLRQPVQCLRKPERPRRRGVKQREATTTKGEAASTKALAKTIVKTPTTSRGSHEIGADNPRDLPAAT